MIIVTNFLALPLLVGVWLIDSLLLLLLLRWLLSLFPLARDSEPGRRSVQLVDPLLGWLVRQLERLSRRRIPSSLVWAIFATLLMISKHLLLGIVMALN